MFGGKHLSLNILKALQWGDSSFPNGSFGFSWGLENAQEKALISRDSFGSWLEIELIDRWCSFDMKVIANFWEIDVTNYIYKEKKLDKFFWSEKLKSQSLKAGIVFLESAKRFGNNMAIELYNRFRNGTLMGHLTSLQGCIYHNIGLDLNTALTVSVHSNAQTIISAAVRLHLISSSEGQKHYEKIMPLIIEKINDIDEHDDLTTFNPLSEISMLSENPKSLFIN